MEPRVSCIAGWIEGKAPSPLPWLTSSHRAPLKPLQVLIPPSLVPAPPSSIYEVATSQPDLSDLAAAIQACPLVAAVSSDPATAVTVFAPTNEVRACWCDLDHTVVQWSPESTCTCCSACCCAALAPLLDGTGMRARVWAGAQA